MRRFISGVTIAGIFLSTVSCTSMSVKRPEVEGVRSHITGIDFEGVNLVFDVDVRNHFSFPLRSPLFRYAIDVAGTELTSGNKTAGMDLPAQSVGSLSIPIRLAYIDVWRVFRNLRSANQADYTLRGNILFLNMGQNIELPISHSGTFLILKIPTVSIMRLGSPQVSGGRAKLEISAEVTNPNMFSLGVEGLGYELQIGDVSIGRFRATTLGSIDAQTSGRLNLVAEISATEAILQLLLRRNLGPGRIIPSGTVRTPYGVVTLEP